MEKKTNTLKKEETEVERTLSNTTTVEASNTGSNAYLLTIQQCAEHFKTSLKDGLNSSNAEELLKVYGLNNLGEGTKISITKILIHQVFNAMILVLIISMIIAFAIRDWISGGVITFVIGLNVFVGAIQEFNAEKTMDSLKSLSTPSARVLRDGADQTIPAETVVPGDIVLIKVGDTIPADLRIVEAMNFETDEALLTGESLPVAKNPHEAFSQIVPVGDRINMAFSSSTVTKGRATGIAVNTGLSTEIGKIAESLNNSKKSYVHKVEHPNPKFTDYLKASYKTVAGMVGAFLGTTEGTPLSRKLSELAIALFGVAVVFAIVVMASQSFHVNRNVAIYAVCVALSMIPSSLIVVLTITMAVGARVMAEKNVIVRKLDSLEALGSINDICSDKTGTLTQGKMIARNVWIPGVGTFAVTDSNSPFNPKLGKVEWIKRSPVQVNDHDVNHWHEFDIRNTTINMKLFMNWIFTASLANIAKVFEEYDEDSKTEVWRARGDPTEIAIQVFVTRLNYSTDKIVNEDGLYTQLTEYPFDSSIKRMTSVYSDNENDQVNIFTKGAVERVLECCSNWISPISGEVEPLTEESMKLIEENMNALSSKGLRVLAFANRFGNSEESLEDDWTKKDRSTVEKEQTFVGLIGIYDPPRPETAASVKQCHKAGINVRMATGDHPSTAKAIAQEVGILPHNLYHYSPDMVKVMVMTAMEFDALSDDEIDALPALPLVIARCAPQTKVRLIDALHRRNKFCAMTGDGVNDSPSLKKADVGIAMGLNGSDVAKDASDIVLSDDNFASILNAIEEGRRMGDNIQKFVMQLLGLNVGQALYLMVGLVFLDNSGYSVFPLSPVEVLWVIIITSCFPAMGLGLEKAAPDVMSKPPRDSKTNVFTWEILIDMFVYGTFIAICCMGAFTSVIYGEGNGQLGVDCNSKYSDSCHYVFKGRSASFAVMTWCALLLAWEVIDLRRSLFNMHPDSERPYVEVFYHLWGNQFLFWSVIAGFVTLFPVVYIPVINDKVFLHKGIGKEWGYAIGFSFAFLLFCELWKWIKRVYLRHRHISQVAHNPEHDLERKDPFSRYKSFTKDSVNSPENHYFH